MIKRTGFNNRVIYITVTRVGANKMDVQVDKLFYFSCAPLFSKLLASTFVAQLELDLFHDLFYLSTLLLRILFKL